MAMRNNYLDYRLITVPIQKYEIILYLHIIVAKMLETKHITL